MDKKTKGDIMQRFSHLVFAFDEISDALDEYATQQTADLKAELDRVRRDNLEHLNKWIESIKEVESLQAENESLKDWKESAMQVMNEIDLQECGKVLNIPLGKSISTEILPALKGLKDAMKAISRELVSIESDHVTVKRIWAILDNLLTPSLTNQNDKE